MQIKFLIINIYDLVRTYLTSNINLVRTYVLDQVSHIINLFMQAMNAFQLELVFFFLVKVGAGFYNVNIKNITCGPSHVTR